MDDNEKKAVLVYVAVVGFIGYMAHTNFAVPEQKRRDSIKKDVDDLVSKRDAYVLAKKKFSEEEAKGGDATKSLDALMARFIVPKSRQGDSKVRIYDTFSLSEQISTAARGLALNPKEPAEPELFLYQAARIPEEDLVAVGDTMQDPANKASLDADKSKVYNTLSVNQVRSRYQVAGDFKAVLGFFDVLNRQKTFIDITKLDLYQKGPTGTTVQATLTLSALDVSDGLVNPGAEPK